MRMLSAKIRHPAHPPMFQQAGEKTKGAGGGRGAEKHRWKINMTGEWESE